MRTITDYRFFNVLQHLYFIDEIWLYGSRARGDNTDRSDIDLAIICPRATEQDWHIVKQIIDAADTLLHIDCIRFDTLPHDHPLKAEIEKDKKILFKRPKVEQ